MKFLNRKAIGIFMPVALFLCWAIALAARPPALPDSLACNLKAAYYSGGEYYPQMGESRQTYVQKVFVQNDWHLYYPLAQIFVRVGVEDQAQTRRLTLDELAISHTEGNNRITARLGYVNLGSDSTLYDRLEWSPWYHRPVFSRLEFTGLEYARLGAGVFSASLGGNQYNQAVGQISYQLSGWQLVIGGVCNDPEAGRLTGYAGVNAKQQIGLLHVQGSSLVQEHPETNKQSEQIVWSNYLEASLKLPDNWVLNGWVRQQSDKLWLADDLRINALLDIPMGRWQLSPAWEETVIAGYERGAGGLHLDYSLLQNFSVGTRLYYHYGYGNDDYWQGGLAAQANF